MPYMDPTLYGFVSLEMAQGFKCYERHLIIVGGSFDPFYFERGVILDISELCPLNASLDLSDLFSVIYRFSLPHILYHKTIQMFMCILQINRLM